ncbi:MAG TPA: hypothetical protein VJ276_08385 [Thermoanaerobaculia bacterium]|nr:hypothetical protein [Thermoanaerobaculia bacterium]
MRAAADRLDDRLNAHHHVVEFMRHLRGKPAETGQAVKLSELLLHPLAVRDVVKDEHQAADLRMTEQIRSDHFERSPTRTSGG